MSARVFIGGLSRQIGDSELRERFEEFGPIDEATVIIDKATGYSRGFGFVSFIDTISMEKAIDQLHGGEFAGRKISVRVANRDDPALLRRRDPYTSDRLPPGRFYDREQEGQRDFREYRESSRYGGPPRRGGYGYGYDRPREERYYDGRDPRDGPRDYRDLRDRDYSPREYARDRDFPREGPRDFRDRSREGSRDLPKDLPRRRSLSRERPRELPREEPRNGLKDGYGGPSPYGRESFRDGDTDFRRERMAETSRFGPPFDRPNGGPR